jgi:hypothetical protein
MQAAPWHQRHASAAALPCPPAMPRKASFTKMVRMGWMLHRRQILTIPVLRAPQPVHHRDKRVLPWAATHARAAHGQRRSVGAATRQRHRRRRHSSRGCSSSSSRPGDLSAGHAGTDLPKSRLC